MTVAPFMLVSDYWVFITQLLFNQQSPHMLLRTLSLDPRCADFIFCRFGFMSSVADFRSILSRLIKAILNSAGCMSV